MTVISDLTKQEQSIWYRHGGLRGFLIFLSIYEDLLLNYGLLMLAAYCDWQKFAFQYSDLHKLEHGIVFWNSYNWSYLTNSMKYCISIRDGKKNCIHLCLYRSLSLFYLFGFAWWFDRYFLLGIYSSENCSNNRDYSRILNHILPCCCFFFLRDSWSITVFLITSSRVSLSHCLLFRLYDEEHRENVWLPDVFFFTIQLNHAFKDMKWKKNTSCESSL